MEGDAAWTQITAVSRDNAGEALMEKGEWLQRTSGVLRGEGGGTSLLTFGSETQSPKYQGIEQNMVELKWITKKLMPPLMDSSASVVKHVC